MANMITNVDFHCEANNAAHRTLEITTQQLVVRRGQSFVLTLETVQPFSQHHPLVLVVETGPAPSERRGTRSEFGNPAPMYARDTKAIWKYDIDKSAAPRRGAVALAVTPPADAPVGRYRLSTRTGRETTPQGTLVVLFNPWCKDDWVHLPDEKQRQEYVMNEQGLIYVGTSTYLHSMTWIFGQFEEDMVDICLKILDVNPKHAKDPADDVSARCNPIYVSRVVSAMINSNDDRGVLEGRWHDDYHDGVAPTHWNGSVSILQRWYQNHCQRVKYGQCWVYAGVMCTVMRFLGIPCRVVTNFQSAHDTNNSLTIDRYYDDDGLQDAENRDSIWNFHVWVEGWMKRPDLQKGDKYDGWQVLDPTPQERSQGAFRCGPAPVAAVLQGDTDVVKYDVPFVFSEVNADIVKWMVSARGKRKMHCDSATVGQNISTKAVGLNLRDDITHSYKHREGSAKERAVFKRAVTRVNSGDDQDADGGEEPLKVEMKLEQETNLQMGRDIKLRLRLRNKDGTSRTMLVRINAQPTRVNGKALRNIHRSVQEKMLLPGQDVSLPIHIPFSVYGKAMAGCDSMKVSAVATDKQRSDDIYETETDIALEAPPISVKVRGEARRYRTLTVEVAFTNPLNEALRSCSLTVIGSGLFKSDHVKSDLAVLGPQQTLKLEIQTIPYRAGLRTLVADFDCSAFRDVKGSCTVDVKP